MSLTKLNGSGRALPRASASGADGRAAPRDRHIESGQNDAKGFELTDSLLGVALRVGVAAVGVGGIALTGALSGKDRQGCGKDGEQFGEHYC
jgi:hypothetical protein